MTLGVPLLSLATMFGVKTQEWRTFMGGGAAILMVTSIAMKLWSLPKERAEVEQQELDRAKGALRTALRQLFSALQPAWSRGLSPHFKDAQEAIQSQLDTALQAPHGAGQSGQRGGTGASGGARYYGEATRGPLTEEPQVRRR
jgi:hypothetical protein